MLTHTLGFPRIGVNRELKKAVEAYWSCKIPEAELGAVANDLRLRHWTVQKVKGIDLLPVNDFSLYDHMLDMCALLGCVPERYGYDGGDVGLDLYFRMARGGDGATAMEMTKWFDTNYHYIVPEFRSGQGFGIGCTKLQAELKEAREAHETVKPVLVGPVTFMLLGKAEVDGFDRWTLFDDLLSAYEKILGSLDGACDWVQLDEPALCLDLEPDILARFQPAYERLADASPARILLATYFGRLAGNLPTALSLPVDGLHVDCVAAPEQVRDVIDGLGDTKMLSLGLVNGRNIWATDLRAATDTAREACVALGPDRVMVAPSCSLLHVPIDLDAETRLDPDVRAWMAFAKQKCSEVRVIADACLIEGGEPSGETGKALIHSDEIIALRRESEDVHDPIVKQRCARVTADMACREVPFTERRKRQQAALNLPLLPTTTIGSFPQTKEIRAARRKFKRTEMTQEAYEASIREAMHDVIAVQDELDLDVLVHGECERNDMVEYFGEQMKGYCFTDNGWVQSYGSRCVKPPILYGDVSRPAPMTVDWITAAAKQTSRPMKGMLTGPVTMLCWSFVRDDQSLADTCRQLALAVLDEVKDLEAAGIHIIQIDEPALREGMPLRRSEWNAYLEWAVYCFRLATSDVHPETQIHTHMCYSEFNEIIDAIAAMDADVISIEASRSRMELLEVFREFDYPNDIGPGVYDIHSPRVPTIDEMVTLLRKAMAVIPVKRLWVNPDCGLKTRAWPETRQALENMVEAAKRLRDEFGG